MNSEKVSRWLGVGANFGVLLGLILLWTEISQNKEMTRVELGAGVTEIAEERYLEATSGELPEALTMAIYEPNKLTKQQLVVLDNYMMSVFASAGRLEYLIRMGIFDLDVDDAIWIAVRPAMGNQFAQDWVDAHKDTMPPRLYSAVNPRLSGVSPNQDRQRLEKLAAGFSATSQ